MELYECNFYMVEIHFLLCIALSLGSIGGYL